MNALAILRKEMLWKAALGFVFAIALCGLSFAQTNPAASPSSASSSSTEPAAQKPEKTSEPQAATKPGPVTELTEVSKEEASEENIQFKQSPSVKWLAKKTGMSPRAAYWVFFLLNFGILAVAIGWFMKSRLPGWWRDRGESIRHSMEEARRTSEEARGRLSQIEARLARIDAEINELRASADKEAGVEEQRIHAAAEEDKQRIIAAAEQEIAAASRVARRELKTYAAALAVDLAEHRIKVDAQTDRALVRNFAQQFGKDGQ